MGEHLATMGDKLDAANRAKSSFLSSMSHELRTPLTAIIGYAELLEASEGRKLDGERLQQVQAISTAGWTLVKLVDAVLELSRLEHRDLRLATSSMDLMPLIEEALGRARPDAERMRVTLRLIAPETPLPSVVSDPALLRRILDQLLSNAVKYNLPGGLVEVSFGLEAPDTVDLSIRDTGPGIPTDRQAEVFQAFQRLGHENGAISGAGIGMTIAQRLAEVSGCRLSLESTPGKGTVFLLRIPRTRQRARHRLISPQRPDGCAASARFLQEAPGPNRKGDPDVLHPLSPRPSRAPDRPARDRPDVAARPDRSGRSRGPRACPACGGLRARPPLADAARAPHVRSLKPRAAVADPAGPAGGPLGKTRQTEADARPERPRQALDARTAVERRGRARLRPHKARSACQPSSMSRSSSGSR